MFYAYTNCIPLASHVFAKYIPTSIYLCNSNALRYTTTLTTYSTTSNIELSLTNSLITESITGAMRESDSSVIPNS
jgi:hypothetical protein